MLAARHTREPRIIEALVDGGADVRLRNAGGATAYDLALSNPDLTGSAVLEYLRPDW